MRITVQIPKDAAQRLRQLATESNASLRALGINSVQLEGDSVISLNVGGQQIDVKTTGTVEQIYVGSFFDMFHIYFYYYRHFVGFGSRGVRNVEQCWSWG